ncbi:MAG: hypothetical protein MJ009_03350 [Paludibacteraceae bacterium]|nr:hypothetical protein [Paludibacteraceae bacterium]
MKKGLLFVAVLMTAMCAMTQEKFYVYMNDGSTKEYAVADCDSISFTEPKVPIRPECQTALDAEDNWVTIGSQQWLNVNARCIEYDTESEAYVAGITTISTSSSSTYSPYYTDPTTAGRPGYMSEEQFGKLGLLYNWAAAMGYKDAGEAQGQAGAYTGNRQGICPNGSHIPSASEWNALATALGGTSNACKKMKTSTGWKSGKGEGDNGFASLPAGYAVGSAVNLVGSETSYWSSDASSGNDAHYRYLECSSSNLSSCKTVKKYARSVRCIKD